MDAFAEAKQKYEETIAKRTPEEEAALQVEWRAREAASLRRDRWQRLSKAGVPERVLPLLLDGAFEENIATKAARAFLAGEEHNFLLLAGRPGAGKTFAGQLALALHCMDHWDRTPGHVYKASEVARVSLYSDKGLTLDTVKRTPGILLLDDFGAEYATERGPWLAIFEELIDARYENGEGTVITSNLNVRDLTARYGERVMSRIQHTGAVVELPSKAKNYRRAGHE